MKALNEYIASQPKRPMREWAEAFGISRSYLVEILAGVKTPGRIAMAKISDATGGKVPVTVWFE